MCKVIKKIEENFYKVIFILSIIYAIYLASKEHLWIDEIASVGFVSKKYSFFNIFKIFTTIEISNLPLFSMLFYFWYRIPHITNTFLYLFSIIVSYIGIYILIKFCNKVFDKKYTNILILFISTATVFYERIAIEIRAYCLVFTLSIAMLYTFYNKHKNSTFKNNFIYGIIVFLSIFTHYYSVLLTSFFGVVDLIIVIKDRKKWKNLLVYIVPVLSFIIWFILVLHFAYNKSLSFWVFSPNLKSILEVIIFMFNYNKISTCFFIISLFISLLFIFLNRKKLSSGDKTIILIIISCIYTIFIPYIYSKYINLDGSIFLDKYFVVILAYLYMILAYGIYKILIIKINKKILNIIKNMLCLILTFVFFYVNFKMTYTYYDTYYDSCEDSINDISNYIKSINEYNSEDTIVILDVAIEIVKGYVEIYMQDSNVKNVISFYELSNFKLDDFDCCIFVNLLGNNHTIDELNNDYGYEIYDKLYDDNLIIYKKVR